MSTKKKKEWAYSLHGMRVNTKSNWEPKPSTIVRYAWEPIGGGGRVWRIHKGERKSWMCDTVLESTAERMAESLTKTLDNLD